MKVRQYAHFDVGSDVFSPEDVTASLLLEPTKVSRRGSRSTEPMVPRTNLWRYKARSVGCVDDLVRELVDLFEPLRSQLTTLTANGASWIGISVMRSFDDPDGTEEDDGRSPDLPDNLVRVEGQHQLLGFHLDTELMARLVALGCSLDFDEYG